jgi:hypothetical protein
MNRGPLATRLPALALALAAVGGPAGCTTARVDQFQRFAEAGVAYAGAIDALAGEAVNASIDADSAVLIRTREPLSETERRDTVLEHDTLLKERAALLGDIRRHAALLRAYFVALAQLAESDAPAAIALEAEALAESIDRLGAQIGDQSVGGERIGDLAGSAAGIVVGGFRAGALERELRARAPMLQRELELQRAAMQAIADEMQADLEAIINQQELTEVIDPYRSSGSLPRTWARRRREILAAAPAAESVDAAATAAAALGQAFQALVERRYTLADSRAVLADVNAIVTLLERIHGLNPD